MREDVAASWNTAYSVGRYRDDPPVGFVRDILAAAQRHRLRRGLYIGCGNGRNLLPLLDGGLDLIGLDISTEAISELRRRRPDRVDQPIVGDLSALPSSDHYQLVVGIQVFQHGTRQQAHAHLAAAAARVAPGGLLCVRVNATDTDTDTEHHHQCVEVDATGGFTVHYLTGPKIGLDIHFFTAAELREGVGTSFTEGTPTPPAQHPTNSARLRPVVSMGSDLAATGDPFRGVVPGKGPEPLVAFEPHI